jgi:cytochrome c oxidase subunit II
MDIFSIFPARASENAGEVDALFGFLLVVCVAMTALIFALVALFAIKYRRRGPDDPMPKPIHGSVPLEIAWSVVPFLVMLVAFAWGTKLYFQNYAGAPKDALVIYVTGKQWMWKVQHPEGQREINELHVPTGIPVKLVLASEDVIHSFYIPAFRLKHDVVPGQYESYWFEPTQPGRYHLFCAEYCGTNHSAMTGWVTVMAPNEYQNWLAGSSSGSMQEQGQQLFQQFGCAGCHLEEQQGRCPSLRNVSGRPVALDNGRTVIADDAYLRESILDPNAKIVKGYAHDVMPVFRGQIGEERLLQLIVYIKSLSAPAPGQNTAMTKETAKQ